MKYIIDNKSIVTMKGGDVKAKNDETLYATQSDHLEIATMKEIANANGFKVKGKSKTEVKESFDSELSNLTISKVSKMAVSDKIKKIVEKAVKAGKDETAILIEIVNSGVDFQKAIKKLKQAQVDLGLSISNEERAKQAMKILEKGDFEPKSYDDVAKMAKTIATKVPNTNEQQALMQIRKYCKENELEVPKKPKGAGVPDMVKIIAWLHNNVEKCSVKEFETMLNEKTRPDKVVEGWLSKFEKLQTELGIEVETPKAEKPKAKKGKAKA